MTNIFLTQEILEQNGFESLYNNGIYKWKNGNQVIVIDLIQPKCCQVYDTIQKERYEGSITTVNELLLAIELCKINKTIEL